MKQVGLNTVAAAALSWGTIALLLAGCAQTSETTQTNKMERAEQVEIGYGTLDRADVAGSVSSIEATENDRKVARVEEMLEGRVAGVQVIRTPGGGIHLQIRGQTSILGNNQPLYVVDGMPVHTDPQEGAWFLNPEDVENITVLKGPSAAIYGSRGANGVVLIRTKRGR